LYSTSGLRIDYFISPDSTGNLLFTFTEYSNRNLDGFGFAGKFALDNGFDLVAIKSSSDDWYKYLPLEIFDLVEKHLAFIHRIPVSRFAYGSSMGAYAAIYFARQMQVDAVLALSPQFDIGQSWDQRWKDAHKHVGSIPVLKATDVSDKCAYFIAYDPSDLDRIHYNEFKKVIAKDNLYPIKISYSGHPVGYFLSHAGVLKELVRGALIDQRIPPIRNQLRVARRTYVPYLMNLAKSCQKHKKKKWSRDLILQAVESAPLDAECRITAANVLEINGDLKGALIQAAASVALSPKHPHMIATLSRILHRIGLNKQALYYIDQAISILPSSFEVEREAILKALK